MHSTRPRMALPGSIAAGAVDLSVRFEGLANPTRLAVVELLAAQPEVRVSELAERCHISQPRMSWHLRILRQAGIIATRREGREVLCRLDRATITGFLDDFVRLITSTSSGAAGAAASLPSTVINEGTR